MAGFAQVIAADSSQADQEQSAFQRLTTVVFR
jgi:hypothetical protein